MAGRMITVRQYLVYAAISNGKHAMFTNHRPHLTDLENLAALAAQAMMLS